MLRLGKILFLILINAFNAGIFSVALSYLHPDFSQGYLSGKEDLFTTKWFAASLYIHAFAAIPALLIVSLLVLFRLETYKTLHRTLGKIALVLILFLIVPTGWALSYAALGGIAGKLIFFLLASYTGYAAVHGYFAIRRKEIELHRFRMKEVFALLASAIVLRLLLALFHYVFDISGDGVYITAAILSWVPGIIILQFSRIKRKSAM